MLKNCKICGLPFEAKDKRYIYCSKKCSAENRKKYYRIKHPLPVLTKICVACKTEFKTHRRCQKRCKSCIIEGLIEKHYQPPKTVICKSCGKEFLTSTREKYCSEECWIANGKAHGLTKKTKTKKVCVWCHDLVETFSPTFKFCSEECRLEFRRIKRRIYSTFPFQPERQDEAFKQLERLGKDFQLITEGVV